MYKGEWYYSIVDIISILIEQDYEKFRKYWNKLKQRASESESVELVTICHQLKMISKKDGKKYGTDCANREIVFRIIKSKSISI